MPTNAENAYEILKNRADGEEGVGQWFEVTQELINTFADVTHDHQFIHVNPEAAKASPFGTTIAHGFLTLSLLTHLSGSVRRTGGEGGGGGGAMKGVLMGVNYGFDKVRFISPVKVGSRIRARAKDGEVTLKDPNSIITKRIVTIEIEGESRPACVAEWLTMLSFS